MDKKHPHHPFKWRAVSPDGRVAALSIEEQWERITEWRSFLDDGAEEYPMLNSLGELWRALEEQVGDSLLERGADLKRVSTNPLSAFFYFVEMGFYPPPELLLALAECWDVYKVNAGNMSLEEAFLGPPLKGAGNYAGRSSSRLRQMSMRWEFDRLLRAGKTRTEAAQEISDQLKGKPDADSILRMMRGFKGFFAERQRPEK